MMIDGVEEKNNKEKRTNITYVLILSLLLASMLLAANIFLNQYKKDNDLSNIGVCGNPLEDCACDASRFKAEYESYNNQLRTDGIHKHLNVSIPINNTVEYIDEYRLLQMLENGTGVVYLGFPTCPWCRNLIPTLVDVMNEVDQPLYYANLLSIRDIRKLDEDGNIIVEEEGTKEYFELVDKLYEHLGSYTGLEDESLKRIYFPTTLFIKNGEVVDIIIGTIEEHTDGSVNLTTEQLVKLKENIQDGVSKIFPPKCTAEEQTIC